MGDGSEVIGHRGGKRSKPNQAIADPMAIGMLETAQPTAHRLGKIWAKFSNRLTTGVVGFLASDSIAPMKLELMAGDDTSVGGIESFAYR